jgi:hypothetical protein
VLAGAIAVAILILPSALNLPQSNPTTVLEYAPVPPDDQSQPPPAGNLSSLGLGTSGSLTTRAKVPLPPPVDEGIGGRPLQKHCIGNPPRQTEDPASPPCVPFFEGDNFGATYQGVDKSQITVLVYYDVGTYGFPGRQEVTPTNGSYVDIDKPRLPNCAQTNQGPNTDPATCDHMLTRMLKGFSKYFNERFQTYNRHVHYWEYFTQADTAAERRSDAVANWEKLKPFAVIDAATFNGFNQEYQTALARLGVLTFSSTEATLPNKFFRENAPQSWGFWPDIEHWERLYASYVCTKVAPYPVKHYGVSGGQGAPNGQKRKFGLYYPQDVDEPGLSYFTELLIPDLKKCGVDVVEAAYPESGWAVDSQDSGTEAAEAVARFQSANVTTVLYIGVEGRFTNAADAVRYYPEIVIAGALDNDNNFIGQTQNQNAMRNAWAMTFHIRINRLEDAPGYRAYKEGDPAGANNPNDAAGVNARDQYSDHFMLFQGIQVAGPKLTPESVDKGFHAIPERESTSPFNSAFFFDEGDYSSVKDAMEEWWDPEGRSRGGGTPSNRPGCWRVVREGRRSLANHWIGKDDVFNNGSNDPCTGFDGSIKIRPP